MRKPRKRRMMPDHAMYHRGLDLAMHLRGFGGDMAPGEIMTILLAAFAVTLEQSNAHEDGGRDRLIKATPGAIRAMLCIHLAHIATDDDADLATAPVAGVA